MLQKTKQILQKSFYQLLVIYAILVLLISLNLFWKYSLQFQIFAFIIAILGITIISKEKLSKKQFNKKFHYILFALAIILIILFRTLPYISNSIPLGYDTGIYKYGIKHGLQNLDSWILQGGLEPGFLYLMQPLKLIFSSQFILTWLLIGFCALLGTAVYFVTKEFSNKQTGLIALFLYTFSLIQFKAFWFMYYKNIIGMSLLLFSIYFLKKSQDSDNKKYIWMFILLAGLIGAIHRPCFYIFGLSYFFYAFISPYKNKSYNLETLKKNVFYGIGILIISSLFYLGQFKQAILIMFSPVLQGFIQTGESSGTFINFFTYQFSSLFYLPFAMLGLFYFIRKKDFNILVIWAIINFSIVYFQFFFFNRFIIFLDLILIIMASFGFSIIIQHKKKLGIIILIIMLFSAGFVSLNDARDSKPLITESEFQTINYLSTTEKNAFVMSTSSIYSPWILGYSDRKTIAPGLFDYSKHNQEEWIIFWTTEDINQIKEFMNQYEKPLYIFIGQKQKDNLEQFTECFELYYNQNTNKIYKYTC